MLDYELAALSDPAKDQYFLTSPAKIQLILNAAGIQETDAVIEIGAGAGTVARLLPKCASLTLIELDERLIPALTAHAPNHAEVLNMDGLELLKQSNFQADVILANLPSEVASKLAALLPALEFRVAIVAAGSAEPFRALREQFDISVLSAISAGDFTPPQPATTYLISLRHRRAPCSPS